MTLRAIDVSRDAADARDGTRVAFYGWGAAVPLAPFSVDLRTFNATIRAPHISGTYRKFHLDSGASMQRACSGDSGGGAVVYAPTPRLVGVMSLGRDCATETNVNYVVDTLPLAAWLAATASFTLFPTLYPAPPPATLGAPPHNGDITPFWDGARTETYVLSLDDDGATPRSRVLTALNVYARGSPRCAPPIDAPINCTARLAARWPDVFSV